MKLKNILVGLIALSMLVTASFAGYSLTSKVDPTQLSSVYRLVAAEISPDSASGNYTFSGVDTLVYVVGSFCETTGVTCDNVQVNVDSTTVNKVNFTLTCSTGTTAYTTFYDINIIGLGY